LRRFVYVFYGFQPEGCLFGILMKPATTPALGLAYFAYFAVLGIFVPYLPMFLDDRGFNSHDIGLLLAIVTTSRIIGPSLWAMVVERKGDPIRVMRSGAVLAAIGWLCSYVDWGYWPLVVGLGLFSLFWTAILPQLEVSAFYYLNNDNSIYGKVRSFGSVGYILVVILGGLLLQQFGPEFLPWGVTIFLLLLLVTLFLLPSFSLKNSADQPSIRFRTLFKHPVFLRFMTATFLMQISFAPFYGFFILYCRDLGYSGFASGLLIALGVLAEIIAFFYAGKVLTRFSYRLLLTVCYGLTVIRWLMVAFLGADWGWLAFSMLFHAASFALAHSCAMQFIQNFFVPAQRSRGQALYVGLVYGGGGAIGAYGAGILWADGPGATLTFVCAAVVAGGACLMAFSLPQSLGQQQKL
jgi:PPP family 3-phenylpropionic acid transporter